MPPRTKEYKYIPIQVEIESQLRQIKDIFSLDIEQVLGKPCEDITEEDINDLVGYIAGQDHTSDFIFMVGGLSALSNFKNEHERI